MMLVVVAYDVSTESEDGEAASAARGESSARISGSGCRTRCSSAWWMRRSGRRLRARLVGEIEAAEDSLRFYFLGDNWEHRVEHVGAKPTYDPQGPLIV